MSRLRLRSRRVVLPADGGGLRVGPALVEIEGGRIVAVHEGAELSENSSVTAPPDAVEDLGERLLSPAFVNPHTHLALCGLRGVVVPAAAEANRVESLFFDFESRLDAQDVRAFARVGAYESLLAGVGCVWDHYYEGAAIADALEDVGLCGVVAPTLQDLAGPGLSSYDAALETTVEIARSEARSRAGIFAALGPHATDTVSERAWKQVVELGEAQGLPLHMHVAQSVEEIRRVQARVGCDPVTWLAQLGVYARPPSTLSVHAIFAPGLSLRALRPEDRLVVCPRAQVQFGTVARVDRWSAAGAPWLVATDAPASNDRMDVRGELAWVGAQRSLPASFGAAAAELWSATSGEETLKAAEALWRRRSEGWGAFEAATTPEELLMRVWTAAGEVHPAFRTGVVQAGALANLVVWDLDHPSVWPALASVEGQEAALFQALVYGDLRPAIWRVMTLGRWRGEGGAFEASVLASSGWREARDEASARLARLRA